jgi:hypothetical protein
MSTLPKHLAGIEVKGLGPVKCVTDLKAPGWYWWLPEWLNDHPEKPENWSIVSRHPEDSGRVKSGYAVGPLVSPAALVRKTGSREPGWYKCEPNEVLVSGDKIKIPSGTKCKAVNGSKSSEYTQRCTHAVVLRTDSLESTDQVTWGGSGGYWCSAAKADVLKWQTCSGFLDTRLK